MRTEQLGLRKGPLSGGICGEWKSRAAKPSWMRELSPVRFSNRAGISPIEEGKCRDRHHQYHLANAAGRPFIPCPTRGDAMGGFRLHGGLKIVGWVATLLMALAAIGMFATW